MARMTKSEYLASMRHAIHAEDPATGVVLETVLNQAGQRVFDAHPWPWKFSDPVTLAFAENTDTIDLPSDYGKLISCVVQDNVLQLVNFVTPDVIQKLRNNQTVRSSLVYYVSVEGWTTQATPSVGPTPKLMLDRTVTVAGTPTFELTYERDFIPLVDDNSVPNFPPSMEWGLVCMARAMAWGLENDGEHPDMGRAMKFLDEQWDKWRTQQPSVGPVRGGAGDRVRRRWYSADVARYRI